MDSLKIAVCDDDTFFLRQAEHAVKRWAEEQDLTVELQLFDNGDSLLTVSRTEQFDVLLLDIMMPLCDFERLFCARFYRAMHLVFTAKRLRHICILSIGDAYTAGAFVYACLQMPPGTFCSSGAHSLPVLSDQQLDLHHT